MTAVNPATVAIIRVGIRLGFALAVTGLVAACGFQPLYGRNSSAGDESVHDRLSEILIAPIPYQKGTAQERIAVAVHNELQFDLNNAGVAIAPTHRLQVTISTKDITVSVDPVSGRPNEEIDSLAATYQLVEIETGKIVLKDSTFAHVGNDIPGTQQRFSKTRAQLNAQDRAAKVVAEAIRNRLASYFVAGT
jgi:LPS-assembly lipoprotein